MTAVPRRGRRAMVKRVCIGRLFGWRRASDDSDIRRAERAIARLPDRAREIFILHRFDGLSYACIAQRIDIDVEEVETHIAAVFIAIRRARRASR